MYSRKLDGRTLDFEHAKFLYQRSFVLYDRQTVSLWIHTTGESVIGEQKGKILTFIPSTVTTWKTWRTEHPKTQVLNVRKGNNPRFTLRSNAKAGGLSVGVPTGALKLYPLPLLAKRRVINDVLDDKKIVVVFDPEKWVFAAYERGDRTFAWKNGKMVDANGVEWNLLKGTSSNLIMQSVPAVTWFSREWRRFYPEGEIYSGK